MIEVTIEQLHAEACRALGEALVRERLLAAEVHRLTAENEALRQSAQADPRAAVPDGITDGGTVQPC